MTGGLGSLRFDRGTMTGGLNSCLGSTEMTGGPGRWLDINLMTGGLGSWPEFTFVTGGPGKWLINILMTGGLDQTSCDRGTLTFLMGRLQFLMKFTESRKPISNWLQNEHANKTLSLLQATQMPFNHPIFWLVSTWILFQCCNIQTSRASSNNEHIPVSVTYFACVVGPPFVFQRCNTRNEVRSLHKPVWAVLQYLAPYLLVSLGSLLPMTSCTQADDRGTWCYLSNGYLNMLCQLNELYSEQSFKPLYLSEPGCQGAVEGWNANVTGGLGHCSCLLNNGCPEWHYSLI